jgi:hypothetical protein
MHRGYTKAWRKEIDSMIWKMPPIYHRVFFYLRMKVNWDFKLFPSRHRLGIWVSPGMILTSYSQIAEGISFMDNNMEVVPDRKSIMRVLHWMQDHEMLSLACHTEGTTIYLNNWDTYNSEDIGLATSKKQALDTTKEVKRIIRTKEKKIQTPLPPDFSISDRVRLWADKKGLNHLEEHLESFIAKCNAKGYQYVDWDSAFMEAIRGNWAKITPQQERLSDAYKSL